MKKQILIFSILSLSLTSVHASSIAANSGAKDKNKVDQCALKATAKESDNMAKFLTASPDPMQSSFSFSGSYIGGYFGPTNMIIAQDGVYDVPAKTNPQKEFVQARLSWSNGFNLGMVYNTGQNHTLKFSYDYLTNTANTPALFSMPTTYENAASTLSIDGSATGIAGQVTSANGTYKLFARNRAFVEGVHSLVTTPSLKVLATVGGLLGYLEHGAYYNYTQYSLGTVSKNVQAESTWHGGPTSSITLLKSFTSGFSLYGAMRLTTHAANVLHLSQTENFTEGLSDGYTVNTRGSTNLFYNEEEVSLGLGYNRESETGAVFAVSTEWKGGFTGDATMLFSSTAGSQSAKSQGLYWGLFSLGLHYSY